MVKTLPSLENQPKADELGILDGEYDTNTRWGDYPSWKLCGKAYAVSAEDLTENDT
jgi:hypothetical protein